MAFRALIEQSLLKQAGIVVTHLDHDRISINYNDQLNLAPGHGIAMAAGAAG